MKRLLIAIVILFINSITISAQPQKEMISKLMENRRIWCDTSNIDILPATMEKGLYVGLDTDMVNNNISKIRKSNLFSEDFVNNYKVLIDSINGRLLEGYYDKWYVGELPPFRFANDHDPWCNCQGDNNQYTIEFVGISNNCKEFRYYQKYDYDFGFEVRVVFQDGDWKISYLEGFDFENGIKKDGEM
ncbi:MAG: hypothetical protein IKO46_11955 [Salinivirgaceae bacterium]|nr:hypothetical protein [Salinivirgaceae bacterium]